MTRYWPVSRMLNSPALNATQKLELQSPEKLGVSENTFQVCRHVASLGGGLDITMLYSEGATLRRVYLKHPTRENWLALERCILIDTGRGFGLNMDVLH